MTEIRHHIVFMDGSIVAVVDCADAYQCAADNGLSIDTVGYDWHIEVHHWQDGVPVAGGEWGCDCTAARWCDMGCGYKLDSSYHNTETTCGACMNLQAITIEQETQ